MEDGHIECLLTVLDGWEPEGTALDDTQWMSSIKEYVGLQFQNVRPSKWKTIIRYPDARLLRSLSVSDSKDEPKDHHWDIMRIIWDCFIGLISLPINLFFGALLPFVMLAVLSIPCILGYQVIMWLRDGEWFFHPCKLFLYQ